MTSFFQLTPERPPLVCPHSLRPPEVRPTEGADGQVGVVGQVSGAPHWGQVVDQAVGRR